MSGRQNRRPTVISPGGPDRPRTGLKALKARVKVAGLGAIDKRTQAAQHLLPWRREVIGDLGGEASLSAMQRALVESAVRLVLYRDHVDNHRAPRARCDPGDWVRIGWSLCFPIPLGAA